MVDATSPSQICSARPALTALALASVLCLGCRPVEEAPPKLQPGVSPRDPPSLIIDRSPPRATVTLPDFATVARDVGPSVIGVISTIEAGGERLRGIGSGMVVSTQGEILTNEHVVSRAQDIKVQLPDRTQVPATIRYADPLLDLALLQLEREVDGLEPLEFRSIDPSPGEWIMAVGQPFALGDTVTVGVVSGLRRDHADLGSPRDLDPNGIWSFIQTDASINIGNSGGPLVDVEGRVVGITTAVRQDGQGLAFAIPSPMALRFIDEVRTHGRMRHTRLGIGAENTHAHAGYASAVRVTRVDRDGPGDRASLQVDDLILAVDGEPIARVSDVAYLAQLAGVGAKLNLTIARGEDLRTQQVLLIPEIAG